MSFALNNLFLYLRFCSNSFPTLHGCLGVISFLALKWPN